MPAEKRSEPDKTTSERLKTAAIQAVSTENVKRAFANKLLAAGLALVCLAGGVDYFDQGARIHGAVKGVATDAGHVEVASAVESVDQSVGELKATAVESLPPVVRDWLALGTFVIGAGALAAGMRMKVAAAGDERDRVVRDLGRALAMPGFVGVLLFTHGAWRNVSILRNTCRNFFLKVKGGEVGFGDFLELAKSYAPWAWENAGGVLILGLALGAVAVAARVGRERLIAKLGLLGNGIVFRSALFASLLALGFYALATFVAIVSYGGALQVIVWPWKTSTGPFLVGLAFMAVGLALARTGTAELKKVKARAA